MSFTFSCFTVLSSTFNTDINRMKNLTFYYIALIITLLLFPFLSKSQSISGNVKAFESADALSYANVDIYKNDKLVASVFADKDGNFDVKLDTGTYKCEILYAGYKKVIQEIKLTDDEKMAFSLREDGSKKIPHKPEKKRDAIGEVLESESYGSSSDEAEVYMSYDAVAVSSAKRKAVGSTSFIGVRSDGYPIKPMYKPEMVEASAGKLTAGEINDFSKWNLWTDLNKGELNGFQSEWKYANQSRYMVQVMAVNGLPLGDLKVQLENARGEIYFAARTDNTGKAELWRTLDEGLNLANEKINIAVFDENGKHMIKNAKVFERGINSLNLEQNCDQSQKVDIAFVVDATGSMGDELSFLQAELNDVMFKSKEISNSLNFSFANVFYRDIGDQYVTRTQDFTRVLSESVSFINEQSAGGGGDFEEAVEIALDSAINGLTWSTYARARILFLVLDAPPHNTPEIQAQLKRLSLQAAEKGIRIVPLVASGINKSAEYLMRSLALTTNGSYAFLTDHSGIGGQHLAPSTDEYEVEILNDLLVRLIKSYTYMPDCDQNLPNLSLNYPDSSVSYLPQFDTAQTDSTEIEEPIEINWNYYPNPTRGIVNIKANVAINELYITDLSGKVLQIIKDVQPENPVKADLSGYASGIYLIRYPVGKQWISGKVVLLRD